MKDFLSKNWLAILVALVVAFLLFIIFRGCNPAPDHSGEKKRLDSLNNVVEQMKKDSLLMAYDDSLRDQQAARRYDSLREIEKQRVSELKQANAKAKEYAYKYQLAIGNHDTSFAIYNCSELAKEVFERDVMISGFETITDSMANAHIAAMGIKDRQISVWKGLYERSDSIRIENKRMYDGLYTDYKKQVRSNKFNKTLSRILGIAVIVLGGSLYLTNK